MNSQSFLKLYEYPGQEVHELITKIYKKTINYEKARYFSLNYRVLSRGRIRDHQKFHRRHQKKFD